MSPKEMIRKFNEFVANTNAASSVTELLACEGAESYLSLDEMEYVEMGMYGVDDLRQLLQERDAELFVMMMEENK